MRTVDTANDMWSQTKQALLVMVKEDSGLGRLRDLGGTTSSVAALVPSNRGRHVNGMLDESVAEHPSAPDGLVTARCGS